MLYSIVPRLMRPARWKASAWMQLELDFQDHAEEHVWKQLKNEQRAAARDALMRLMIKAAKNNQREEADHGGHE